MLGPCLISVCLAWSSQMDQMMRVGTDAKGNLAVKDAPPSALAETTAVSSAKKSDPAHVSPSKKAVDLSSQISDNEKELDTTTQDNKEEQEKFVSAREKEISALEDVDTEAKVTLEKVGHEAQETAGAITQISEAVTSAETAGLEASTTERTSSIEMDSDAQIVSTKGTDTVSTMAGSAFNRAQRTAGQMKNAGTDTKSSVEEDMYKTGTAFTQGKVAVSEGFGVLDMGQKKFQKDTARSMRTMTSQATAIKPAVKETEGIQKDGSAEMKKVSGKVAKEINKIETHLVDDDKIKEAGAEAEKIQEEEGDLTLETTEALLEEGEKQAEAKLFALDKKTSEDEKDQASVLGKQTKVNLRAAQEILKKVGSLSKATAEVGDNVESYDAAIEKKSNAFIDQESKDRSQLNLDIALLNEKAVTDVTETEEKTEEALQASYTQDLALNGKAVTEMDEAVSGEVITAAKNEKTMELENDKVLATATGDVATEGQKANKAMDDTAALTAEVENEESKAENQKKKIENLARSTISQITGQVTGLTQMLAIKEESVNTDMTAVNADARAEAFGVLPETDAVVKQAAMKLKRDMEGKVMAQEQDSQNLLTDVQNEYNVVELEIPESKNPDEEKALEIIQQADRDMTGLERKEVTMSDDGQALEKNFGIMTETAVSQLEKTSDEKKRAMVEDSKSKIKGIMKDIVDDQVTPQRASLLTMETQMKSDEQKDTEEAAYSTNRAEGVDENIEEETTKTNVVMTDLRAREEEIKNKGLTSLKLATTKAEQDAESVLAEKVTTLNALQTVEMSELEKNLEAKSHIIVDQAQGQVDQAASDLQTEFDDAKHAASEAARKLAEHTEATTSAVQTTSGEFNTEVEKDEKDARALTEEIIRQEAEMKSQERSFADQTTALGTRTDKQVSSALSYIDSQGKKELADASKELLSGAAALEGSAANVVTDAQNEVKSVETRLKDAGNTWTDDEARADSVRLALKKDAEEKLEAEKLNVQNEDGKLMNYESGFEAKMAAEKKMFGNSEEQGKAVMTSLDEDSKDLATETERQLQAMEAQTGAKTGALAGEINSAFKSTGMIGDNAREGLLQNEQGLKNSEGVLNEMVDGVQTELKHKIDETQSTVESLRTKAKGEVEMTQKDTGYLTQYDRQTQLKVLGILNDITNAVTSEATKTGENYDLVQEHATELDNKVGALLEGDAFSQLSKIMEADNFVQEVSVKNGETVNYMQTFSKDQEQYMDALLKSMTDMQYAFILQENEVREEQLAIDADSTSITDAVVGNVQHLVDASSSAGGAHVLEEMTEGTLQMLLEKAQNGSEQDKKNVAILMKRIANAGSASWKHLEKSKILINKINAKISGAHSFEMMKADLARVLEFNQVLVDQEYKRMTERGSALSHEMFYGADGINAIKQPRGYEHLPKWKQTEYRTKAKTMVDAAYGQALSDSKAGREALTGSEGALLQQQQGHAKELQALLAKNKQLSLVNTELRNTNQELGAKVDTAWANRQPARQTAGVPTPQASEHQLRQGRA